MLLKSLKVSAGMKIDRGLFFNWFSDDYGIVGGRYKLYKWRRRVDLCSYEPEKKITYILIGSFCFSKIPFRANFATQMD